MSFFYEGDPKWESWMHEFGVFDLPKSGAMAQWPKFQTQELQLALDAWQEPPQDRLEWERKVQPLYDTWLSYHLVDRDLKQRGAGTNIQYQLRCFPARAAADKDAMHLTNLLEAFIRDLASDMRQAEPKFTFHPDLGGSSSHGTKLGPMDEYDFKIVLSGDLEQGDPALRRLYSGLSRCLGRWRAGQDPDSELKLLGHVINNARLPSVVFEWRKAQTEENDLPRFIKVDLAPIVPNKPWTGKRTTDPLGRPITTQNYLLVYSSDYRSAEWRECEPTWKPSSCGVEQTILTQLPPAVKKACVLLKILTSHITVPHFKKSVPKDCKFTSYSVKDCLFWALADGRLKAYWDLAPEEQDDVGVVMLIAKEILMSMRKHHEEYFTFSDKPRHYHPFLHRMFTALVTGQIPAPDRDSSSAAIPPGAAYGRLSTPPVARCTSAPVYNQNITTGPTTVNVKVEPGTSATSGHEFTMLWDEFRRQRENMVTRAELEKQAEQHKAEMSQIQMQLHSLQLQLNSVLYQNAENVSGTRKRRRVDYVGHSNQLQYFGENPNQGFAGSGIQTTSNQPVLNVVNNHSTQNVYLPQGSSGLQQAGSWSSGHQANLTSLAAADTGDMTMPPTSSFLSMPPPQPGSVARPEDQAVTGPVARSGPLRPTHRVSLPVDFSMSSLSPQAQLPVPHGPTLQDANHDVGSSQDSNKSATAMVRRNPPPVIPAPPPAHAPTKMTVSSVKTLERFSKMTRLGVLDDDWSVCSFRFRFSANESHEVLMWKDNILAKYKFVNRTFEKVWKKTRPFSIDKIEHLHLLPNSSIIVNDGFLSSPTTTQVYSAHCELVSTYTGDYGYLEAASATRLVYWHGRRLVVYSIEFHRRLGELTPPPGAGVFGAKSVCVSASGRVVVRSSGKLCVYSADCQLLHTCDNVFDCVSCSDEYIVTGWRDTLHVYSWELEKKAEIRVPEGDGIRGVACGAHGVVFAECWSQPSHKLVAYQLE